MGKMIKSYLVFTSAIYRIAMFILIPILVIGFSAWMGSNNKEVALLLAAVVLTMFEIISDSWLFGGIQARDQEKIDYLKTSGRGMRLLRNALMMDLLRKFLCSLLVLGGGYFVLWFFGITALKWVGVQGDYGGTGAAGTRIGILLCFALTSYLFSTFGTFLSRFGSMFWINMLTSYLCMILTMLCLFLMASSGYNIWFCDLLLAAFCAGISILTVRIAMGKYEGGYYDK